MGALLPAVALPLRAQEGAAADTAQEAVAPDTASTRAVVTTQRATVRDTVPPVTPVGALVRSLVLPGWGQTAVGRPARGAVYFVAEAASLFMVFKTQAKLDAARRGVGADSTLVESREQQREDWIVLSVFWALMSGVDAWVSTHLYGFEGQLTPPEDGSAGVAFHYRVPIDLP